MGTTADMGAGQAMAGAGRIQGITLVLPVVMPVMAAVLMAPVIPALSASFATTPNADILVPLAITIPALMLALFSPLAGWAADRFGRRNLLIAALALYAVFGTAPLYLASLQEIIVSRALLGICEAAIMTCSTALLGDYFYGKDREYWLTQQSIVASLSAIVFVTVGGILGESGWRAPFAVYALALALIPPIVMFIREPEKQARAQASGLAGIPWRLYGSLCGLAMLASLLFYIVPIQIGFLLATQGITSPQMIGLATAAGTLAVPVGALGFRRVSNRDPAVLAALGLAVMAIGLAIMAASTAYGVTVAGAVVHGLGWGVALPVLLTWAMSFLSYELRGRGTGVFMGAVFVGQFLSPMVVLAVSALSGSLPLGVAIVAGGGLLVAAVALAFGRGQRPA